MRDRDRRRDKGSCHERSQLHQECVRLGEVRGSGAWGNPFNRLSAAGKRDAKKAVKMGGDTVLITYQTRTGSAGEVYRCSQAK